ncbi:MAG: glycosyltransferase, partial [Deltaproteobacteria bacterium]
MPSPKKIGVVMATYNGEKFIKEQVESILGQTIKPNLFVIVDDCSNDGTYEILQQYASKNSFMKVYRNEQNLGCVKNFHKAISLCDTDYIAFSDQDDKWLPNKIEVCLHTLQENGRTSCKVCFHDVLLMYEDGSPLGTTYRTLAPVEYPLTEQSMWNYLLKPASPVLGMMMFFESGLLKQYVNELPFISHDWFVMAMYGMFHSPVFIETPLSYYRLHSQQVSGAMDCLLENTIYERKQRKPIMKRVTMELKRFVNRFNKCRERERVHTSLIYCAAFEKLEQIACEAICNDAYDNEKKARFIHLFRNKVIEIKNTYT